MKLACRDWLYPRNANLFGGILGEACLSYRPSVCPSVRVQSIGDFVSQTTPTFAALLLELYVDTIYMIIYAEVVHHADFNRLES